MNSKFIVIEGLDGSGKTNAIKQVVNILRERCINEVILTKEPGGTPLAEVLRMLIKNGIEKEPIVYRTELLMLYAARVQLVERVIQPALARGAWVVGDRHDLSSQAYQGGGRCINASILQTLRNIAIGNFRPDLTFYLDIPPSIGLSRIHGRNILDRIERESLAFFTRVRARYQALAALDDCIITIDASEPLTVVNSNIRYHFIKWLDT